MAKARRRPSIKQLNAINSMMNWQALHALAGCLSMLTHWPLILTKCMVYSFVVLNCSWLLPLAIRARQIATVHVFKGWQYPMVKRIHRVVS